MCSLMSRMNNTNEKPCSLISWSITGKRGREPATTTTSSYSSSFSSSEEEEEEEEEEQQTAHFLVMLSSSINTVTTTMTNRVEDHHHDYRCESCGKSFSSYQALGGHRAGHFKNAKAGRDSTVHHQIHIDHQINVKKSGGGETEERFDSVEGEGVLLLKNNKKMHQCPICKMGFSSGQALGGHKRRHWERKSYGACIGGGGGRNDPKPNDNNVAAEEEVTKKKMKKKKKKKKKSRLISSLCLDLNLPPPLDTKEESEEKGGGKCFSIAAVAAEVSSAPSAAAASPLMAPSYCYC